jgi:hypothetical protein
MGLRCLRVGSLGNSVEYGYSRRIYCLRCYFICSIVDFYNTMHATQFVEKSLDARAWRKQSRALRRSADVLWDDFSVILTKDVIAWKKSNEHDFSPAIEALETTKFLYGLALETALKAWLIENFPEKIEIRLSMSGDGSAKHAELKSFGVPSNQGHNILGLAEAAGIFGSDSNSLIKTDSDIAAIKSIFRDLGEVVVWRGRYPVPMSSFEPLQIDPKVSKAAHLHYLRDWIDPILDMLLSETPIAQS